MCEGYADSSGYPAVLRLCDKSEKIETHSKPNPPVAGAPVVPDQWNNLFASRVQSQDNHSRQKVQESLHFFPQRVGETAGSTTFCSYSGSSPENNLKRPQQDSSIQSTEEIKRSKVSHEERVCVNVKTMDKEVVPKEVGPSITPPSISYHPYRCISRRVGRSFREQERVRYMVPCTTELPHQCVRTHGSLPDIEISPPQEGGSHQIIHRQPNCGSLSEKGWLQSQGSESCGVGDCETVPEKGVVHFANTLSRSPERNSRCTLQAETTGGRVVSGSSLLPGDLENLPDSPSRPLRHEGESQTPSVCDTLPRSNCGGEGRIESGLEQIQQPVPVPSDEFDFEGFDPAVSVPGRSRADSTLLAKQPVVPSTSAAVCQPQAIVQPGSVPASARQGSLRLLLADPKPSRLVFLKSLCFHEYSSRAQDLITSHVRDSSNRQYQSSWRSFVNYVRKTKPKEITKSFMADYLVYLFDERQLQVDTIKSHKSALVVPIRLAFNIELNSEVFHNMIEGMALKRPKAPNKILSWDLDIVLGGLTRRSDSNITFLLQKTLFLIALAMGARVSELAALKRGNEFCLVREDNVIFSFGNFLAKNEKPLSRREPISVSALKEDPKLCPVATLRKYLDRTSQVTDGPIFVHPDSGVPLKPYNIRLNIVKLIRKLQPGSVPSAHDMRKYASSLAFFGNMSYEKIVSYTGWSGHRVFMKHYLHQIRGVHQRCIALGSVIGGE